MELTVVLAGVPVRLSLRSPGLCGMLSAVPDGG